MQQKSHVGERKQIVRDFDPERLGGLDIDDELKPGRLQDRQIGGFGTVENFARVDAHLAIQFGSA